MLTIPTEPAPEDDGSPGRPGWVIPAVVAGVLVVAVAGFGLWYLFGGDAPAEVDLEAAAEAVAGDDTSSTTQTPTTQAPATTATPTTQATDAPSTTAASATTTPADTTSPSGGVAGGVAGTWVVDTSVGEFNFEDATASFVGFRVDEELAGIGAATAVGRTPDVAGSITIDGTTVTEGSFDANLVAIVSNESRRDGAIQDALSTDEFPTATFALTEPIELGDQAAAGEPITAEAVGDLTVAGVTNQITMPIEAQLIDDLIVVVGSTDIVFADYGVSVPSAAIVLSVQDQGILEVQFWLSR